MRWVGLLLLTLGACARPAPVAPPRAPAEARLWLGGDVNLGPGGRQALAALRPLVADAAGFVNLEGPVAPAQPAGEGLKLFNAPGALPELAELGVRVAGIANNHALDTGPEGPARTAASVRAAGLLPAGGPAGPAVLELGPERVVITAHDLEHGVPAGLAEELARAKALGGRLVATFHVTGPPSYLPPPELREAAELALAAGAEVVAGHGSHMLGPVERRGGAVILWGLGNLAFACDCTDESDALLVRLRFGPGRVEAEAVPIDAGLRGGPATPAQDPGGLMDLLGAVGSKGLVRERDRARF